MKNINYVQWINNFGGLERITQDYENLFEDINTCVILLRYNINGLKYKNSYVLKYYDYKIISDIEFFFYVKKNKSDIFHLQYCGTRILLLAYLAGARKIIFHFHGTKFKNNITDKIIWKALDHKILKIANSRYTESVIRNKLNTKDNIEIIPNLINLNTFKYHIRKKGKVFKVLYAGRFTSGKNLEPIIQAASLLKECDIEFSFYGDGDLKDELLKMVQTCNLQNIRFFPFTNDIINVYKEANLFIFLSSYESFGNVVAEALLTGLPVLCNKIPTLQEFIDDDIFFINSLDPKILSQAIIQCNIDYDTLLYRTKLLSNKVRAFLNEKRIHDTLFRIYKTVDTKQSFQKES